jgi:hypothetical protein
MLALLSVRLGELLVDVSSTRERPLQTLLLDVILFYKLAIPIVDSSSHTRHYVIDVLV